MNVTVRMPRMTREQFLDWVERQETPYEFDGFEPVAMTGGNRRHARICQNLYFALRSRLEGSGWELLGEAGVATEGNAVRYPDALLTRTPGPETDRLMPGVAVVFEVISPSSGRIDRVLKLREYRAVPTITRFILIESTYKALTVHWRSAAGQDWTVTALSSGESLPVPEAGIEVPVDELYRGLELAE